MPVSWEWSKFCSKSIRWTEKLTDSQILSLARSGLTQSKSIKAFAVEMEEQFPWASVKKQAFAIISQQRSGEHQKHKDKHFINERTNWRVVKIKTPTIDIDWRIEAYNRSERKLDRNKNGINLNNGKDN